MALSNPLPSEGSGWRLPVIGPWLAAATSLKSFDAMVCQPDPYAYAVGTWFGALHFMVGVAKPVPWAPSIGEVAGGTPHGGRRKGRRRQSNHPRVKFRTVYNLPAESEFQLSNGLHMAAFKLGGLALEVGYIIFLADLFRDSLLVGTSAAYRYAGCVPALIGPAYGKNLGQPMTPIGTQLVSFGDVYDPSNLIDVNRFRIPAGAGITFAYTINVTPFPPAPTPIGAVSCWIMDDTAGVKVYGAGTSADGTPSPGGYKIGNMFKLPAAPTDRVYSIHAQCRGGFALLTGSTVNLSDSFSMQGSLLYDP